MTDEEVAVVLKDHENKIKSLSHRMDEQKAKDQILIDLTTSVKTLAVKMNYMAKEQTKLGDRMECLEREPAEEHKNNKRTITNSFITATITAIISVVVGAAGAILAILH